MLPLIRDPHGLASLPELDDMPDQPFEPRQFNAQPHEVQPHEDDLVLEAVSQALVWTDLILQLANARDFLVWGPRRVDR